MTTSDVSVPGGSQRVPTYAFTEDAKTKDLERVALNESDGSDLALGAKLGALTETAPVSDTASSGVNGRLQRIAQRLSTLITAVGTPVYGAGTAAAAERVTLASDDPAVATLGATSGTPVITDANGTIQQYLRGLIKQWIAGTLVLGTSSNVIGHVVVDSGAVTTTLSSSGYSAAVTLTRTADTNAYAANDVLGAATGSTAALTFASVGPNGGEVMITSASLEIDSSAVISGETSYRLYLYNVTPPSATGDNGAFDLPSGDRASFLGYIDLGTPVDLGSTLYVQTDNINKQIKLSGTNIYAYLVTNGAYTPTSARIHVITLHTVSV
ncbi:MAG TPA: hypothetical protein VNH44_08725 [Micropepsaceae bacterium]|nr:hypothetical protein [Micropepsaceae bacterium]